MLVKLGVLPGIGGNTYSFAVFNDGSAGHVEVELRVDGAVNTQLLTGNYKHTVFAVFNKHGA